MTKKTRKWIFPVALLAYALVFLCVIAVGLSWFWEFIDAYEMSRPKNTLDAYMETLTPEYVADRCSDLIATIDHNVQSEQECREVILAALDGKFSCAKKNKESTEDHYVYALRCGPKVIGTVEMRTQGEEIHGFKPWQVTAESFDLSYLLTESASITVPKEFSVFSNGRQLSAEYITQENLHYSLLEEFYKEYTLPTMVTYKVGPFLQEVKLTVTDPAGNAVTVDENTDYNAFLNNCTDAQKQSLDGIIGNFVKYYVDVSTMKDDVFYPNYYRLEPYMVPNGALAARIKNSQDGLSWIDDREAILKSITVNAYVNIGGGRYMCDVTFITEQMVTSSGGRGDVTNHMKLIFLETDKGLKAEAMKSF